MIQSKQPQIIINPIQLVPYNIIQATASELRKDTYLFQMRDPIKQTAN